MMRSKYLGAVAISGLLSVGGMGTAQAVPAYAYASLGFTNFTLSGIFDAGGNEAPALPAWPPTSP